MMDRLKLKFPPAVQVLVFAVIIWQLGKIYPMGFIPLAENGLVAITLVLLGALIVVFGGIAFRKAKTTVDPRYPANSTSLVILGVYQYTRNPMYVGMLLSLTGLVIYFGKFSGFFVLPLFIWTMNEFQIKWEEKALLEKFGDSYSNYLKNVRRWL